jgi:hypothetical protein
MICPGLYPSHTVLVSGRRIFLLHRYSTGVPINAFVFLPAPSIAPESINQQSSSSRIVVVEQMSTLFLNRFVRPDGAKPPVSQLFVWCGRISSFQVLNTSILLSFYLYFLHEYGTPGFIIFLLIGNAMTVLDGLVSNGFGRNVQRLRKAGYSDATILFFMEYNRISSQFLMYTVLTKLVPREYYSWQYILHHVHWDTILKIAINFLQAELLFWLGHMLLHTNSSSSWMHFHVFHHCCVDSTWNTNLLFHPVDLAIEFTGPALGILALHRYCWNEDPMVLWISFLGFQLWYAYEHDEHLKLPHVQHHAECNSVYVIYSKLRNHPRHNHLKRYMQEHGFLSLPSMECLSSTSTTTTTKN